VEKPDLNIVCQMTAPRLGTARWTLQQDGTPSHTARNTFGVIMSPSSNQTPNSPDLNQTRWIVPFGGPESLRTWNNRSMRSCWSGTHCHRGSSMAVSTGGGVDCMLSFRRMVDILNTSSTSCRHLYSITLLFVAYVITGELFAGV